tara:strand:+ start:189 stop:902 length:714 start_codon:yes stop_codon:yes gene_type:complete
MDKKEIVKGNLSRKYFSKIADSYDSSRVSDIREVDLHNKEFEIVREFLGMSKKGKILDVACGTGAVFSHYGDREIYGIDISKDMLKHAKDKHPKAKLKIANAENIPYSDGTFSVVITSRFICHTPEYREVIKDMARVVKKDGSLIIDFPNKYSLSMVSTIIRLWTGKLAHYNMFSFSEIKKIARANNLRVKNVKSKVFIPPKILPKQLYGLVKNLNNGLSKTFPLLSTPIYVRFEKK